MTFADAEHGHSWSELRDIPADLADGDSVLARATVEDYARRVCYDTPAEVTAAFPRLDVDASDDLTTATVFRGDVTGTAAGLRIAASAVGTPEIANGAVSAAKVAAGGIGTRELANDSVTAAKLASSAVTGPALAAGAAGPNAVELPMGSMQGSRSGSNGVGDNFLFDTAVSYRPTETGRCLLMISGAIQGVDAADTGFIRVIPAFRIGTTGMPRRFGSASSGNITVDATDRASASNSGVVAVQANQTYFFGCSIFLSSASLVDEVIFCSASWICT